jgi:hypothetical protein
MKLIKLTKGAFAAVDNGDFEWLNQYKWFYSKCAKRAVGPHGKQKQICMHNVIMNPPKGMFVDHMNGDRLDNTKENLRLCTNEENQRNRKVPKNNTTGYKGVTSFRGLWRVIIQRNFIGYYKNKEEAVKVYNNEAKKRFGSFAKLNKI